MTRSLPSLLLMAVAVTAVGAAAVSTAKVVSQAVDRSRHTDLERRLAPTEMSRIDPRVFLVARRVIPRDARYAVVVGTEAGAPQIALDAAPQFAPFWLLPRRQIYPPQAAEWIIGYGGDLESLRLKYRRIIRVAAGMAVAEVATA